MKTRTSFQNCRVVSSPAELIGYGRSLGYFFQEMEEKGMLEGTYIKSDWIYQQDSNTFPLTKGKKEAYKRLDEVIEARFPIKQVIYGYQITTKEEDVEIEPASQTRPKLSPQPKLPDNSTDVLGKVLLGAGAVLVGAAYVLGYAFLMALSAADPCLVVVLDTGESDEECPWVCLSSWEE